MDAQFGGSGGLGAVSVGIPDWLFLLILFGLVALGLVGIWKLAKIVWAMFSGV